MIMKNKAIILDTWQGHIVLICKGHYIEDISIFDALRRIWETRCGLSANSGRKNMDEYIANELFAIIQKTRPNSLDYIHQIIHKGLSEDEGSSFFTKPKGLSVIERVIWEYALIICNLQIRDSDKKVGKWKTLISLPKPQKRIIRRIVRGGGVYKDYELLTKKDNRKLINNG